MGGGDKTLRNLGGESLLERVISLAKPQVDQLVINANGDITRFSQFGITVIKDVIDDFVKLTDSIFGLYDAIYIIVI